jgi:hypothetical protein
MMTMKTMMMSVRDRRLVSIALLSLGGLAVWSVDASDKEYVVEYGTDVVCAYNTYRAFFGLLRRS